MKNETPSWLPLDNAAKIYPPAMTKRWNALFRVSATLKEPIDPDLLYAAQLRTLRRFPTFSMRLRKGIFWYYLDKIDGAPEIQQDFQNPCAKMNFSKNRGFAFRVRYYNCRIALEVFHVLTDGTGGMSFLKTLVAEYLSLKHHVTIPREGDLLDCSKDPLPEEMEDGYLRYAGSSPIPEAACTAYHLNGTPNRDFLSITTGIISAADIAGRAKALGITVTEFLTAVLVLAVTDWKKAKNSRFQKSRPVKITVPVNLRKMFPSRTVRNFANYANVGIDTRLGEYSFEEVAMIVHHQLKLETSPKRLAAKIASNVGIEKNAFMRLVPLFIKNPVMHIAYRLEGDRKSSSCLSNLGLIKLPGVMEEYIERFDFMLGSLLENPVACAMVGYGDKLYINFSRTILEPFLERAFFTRLVKMGIHVKVESNRQ